MHTLSLGFVSDEITPDFRAAARYAIEWGVSIFELRVLKTGRVPNIDRSEMDDVKAVVRQQGLQISALSPGLFKHPLSQTSKLEDELLNALPRTLALARELSCPLVIVFGFNREQDESPDNFWRAVDWMRRAAEQASREGVTLAVENEPGFWCDSGRNTSEFVETVNSPALGANWDPCNAYGTGENPYPQGYEAIRKSIVNVHVKDTLEGSLIRCVPVGEGAINWRGQLKALVEDRVVSHITIETHCLPLIEKSKQNVETLRRYLSEIEHRKETPA
jgi:sugar phosphate isomerase/epimerase